MVNYQNHFFCNGWSTSLCNLFNRHDHFNVKIELLLLSMNFKIDCFTVNEEKHILFLRLRYQITDICNCSYLTEKWVLVVECRIWFIFWFKCQSLGIKMLFFHRFLTDFKNICVKLCKELQEVHVPSTYEYSIICFSCPSKYSEGTHYLCRYWKVLLLYYLVPTVPTGPDKNFICNVFRGLAEITVCVV